jgi:hypothetical protein
MDVHDSTTAMCSERACNPAALFPPFSRRAEQETFRTGRGRRDLVRGGRVSAQASGRVYGSEHAGTRMR